uniref:Uncharacterized protein n=1 Tax=Panagrolaimus davidi TaxID=227884 RepID=A0A914R3Z5_9BILA
MLKFVNKIQLFSLYYLTYFEPINFSEFLKKNFDSMGEVWVRFDPKMDANEAENWEKEVEADLIGHCWSGNETPMIKVFKPYE